VVPRTAYPRSLQFCPKAASLDRLLPHPRRHPLRYTIVSLGLHPNLAYSRPTRAHSCGCSANFCPHLIDCRPAPLPSSIPGVVSTQSNKTPRPLTRQLSSKGDSDQLPHSAHHQPTHFRDILPHCRIRLQPYVCLLQTSHPSPFPPSQCTLCI
jgi:hypothetical protein